MPANSSKRSRKKKSSKQLADVVDWQRVFDFGPKEAKAILAIPGAQRVFAQAFEAVYPWAWSQATTPEDALDIAYVEALKETFEFLCLR